ncbi:MAG: CapA family protein [marine benthic group bacterium]|nr:CapA family protein [Gemmatimonadota bacterium]
MNSTTRPADRPHSLHRGIGGLLVLASFCAPGSAAAQSPGSAFLSAPAAASATDTRAETIRIVAVGDIMMGTAFPDSTYLDPRIVPGVSPADLIGADLVEVLRSGDVVFGNLEGALFDEGGESKRCRNMDACYAFRSPEWYAGLLAGMGFNLMSLANNHSGDFLEAGRATTIAALEEHGIAFGGLAQAGAITGTLELADGTRVGLAGFSPNKGTVSIHDLDGLGRLVSELDRTHDLVIVSFHGGAEGADRTHVTREPEEFYGERRGNVYEFAHAAVDAGADVVIGHGPHVPRAVEVYRDRFIAYSLGNFWTWARFNLRGPNGLAPVLDLEVDRQGRVTAARVVSARQTGLGSPRLDPGGRAARLIAELSREDFPEIELEFGADGRISWSAEDGASASNAGAARD